jgi:hypothetical protein
MESELRIQSEICKFYNNEYCLQHHTPRCLILAIPNGGERNKVNAMMSIAAGEYAGASDLLVIHYGKLLFIEVKTADIKKSFQKPKQKLFQEHVEAMGFKYFIVRSLGEFKAIIENIQ